MSLGASSRGHARSDARYGRLLCLGLHPSPNALYENHLASVRKNVLSSGEIQRGVNIFKGTLTGIVLTLFKSFS